MHRTKEHKENATTPLEYRIHAIHRTGLDGFEWQPLPLQPSSLPDDLLTLDFECYEALREDNPGLALEPWLKKNGVTWLRRDPSDPGWWFSDNDSLREALHLADLIPWLAGRSRCKPSFEPQRVSRYDLSSRTSSWRIGFPITKRDQILPLGRNPSFVQTDPVVPAAPNGARSGCFRFRPRLPWKRKPCPPRGEFSEQQICPILLLTGAGFTRNFGGFLGDEMWARILNHNALRAHRPLRSLLLKTHDFEAVYETVVRGNEYPQEQRKAIQDATWHTYELMETSLGERFYHPNGIHEMNFQNFVEMFRGCERRPGLLFTLNQDLLIERFFDRSSWLSTPGMHGVPFGTKVDNVSTDASTPSDRSTAVAQIQADLARYPLCYIKLHGSHRWINQKGAPCVVVGQTKRGVIGKEPILDAYFEVFRRACQEPRGKMLIVGYGFGDSHVNEALIDGIRLGGLRLVIVSPRGPKAFTDELRVRMGSRRRARVIWEAMEGYFPYGFDALFTIRGATSDLEKQLASVLFG